MTVHEVMAVHEVRELLGQFLEARAHQEDDPE